MTCHNIPSRPRAIYEALPLEAYVRTWGEEIYFEVAVNLKLEKGAKTRVRVGDLAYWPEGPAFAYSSGHSGHLRPKTCCG